MARYSLVTVVWPVVYMIAEKTVIVKLRVVKAKGLCDQFSNLVDKDGKRHFYKTGGAVAGAKLVTVLELEDDFIADHHNFADDNTIHTHQAGGWVDTHGFAGVVDFRNCHGRYGSQLIFVSAGV